MSAEPPTPAVEQPDHTYDHAEADELARAVKKFEESDQPNQSHREHASQSSSDCSSDEPSKEMQRGKRELTEDDCYDKLGFCFPWYKKWTILTVIFIVQISMNFNTGVYANAVPGLQQEFGIRAQAARVGQMIFLVSYAFGSEFILMNVWQIPCAVAPNFGTIVVCRALGGLSSAGGSVTLGMTADILEAEDQGYAVAYVVLSSVGGSTVGPFFGGFIGQYLSWHWVFWVQLIFGGVTQVLHFFLVPETRATILIDREARRRRKTGDEVYGPNEVKTPRLDAKDVLRVWRRPFEMFLREPIVLCLSLLSGFSDALIFIFTESFSLVFEQWGFNTLAVGMTLRKIRKMHGPAARLPECRLLLLLFIAPLEPIGLLGFAWTSMGPAYTPWVARCIFACLIAMANYGIYMATIDYMVAAYGPYSASATGGNGFSRDFLAGIATMYATPMYENIGGRFHLQWARPDYSGEKQVCADAGGRPAAAYESAGEQKLYDV
ncbi:hypothetical protein Aspvir_006044 [Aspergillus viridinutans]|uniref:Uncharacterized protein n=1 Tax=Aspergillus viridinutans TaxID=75553 RepID=A0A9P3BYM5_ASPVI|nr:uncharacterized protein Aspvir_006044 [Aspergillus viridinutans]GIK02001.1 hypothetical protein Aspvir_006044 [Aspergillus viridinutans]